MAVKQNHGILPEFAPEIHYSAPSPVVPQPELRNQLGRSKLSKLREIDGVYQLRGAVGGANPPLRLVLGSGGETPPAMWGERLRKEMPSNDEWRLWGGILEAATRLSVELRSHQVHPEPLWFAHPDLRL
jgi:hypothetical protein